MMVDTDDLVTIQEIAWMGGVTPPAVCNWIQRYDTFPTPLMMLGDVRGWSRRGVQRWLKQTGRIA